MPEIVIDTGVLIALVAATGEIGWLADLYDRILIPAEVRDELAGGGPSAPELPALAKVAAAEEIPPFPALPPWLLAELDIGEAAVIHAAARYDIPTVAIDEQAGRRVARLHGLNVTGSLGILMRAKRERLLASMGTAIANMRNHGIWIAEELVVRALEAAGET